MEYVVYGLLVFLFSWACGHGYYWKGYYKGYNKAKEIYDETCSPEEFIERIRVVDCNNLTVDTRENEE